MPRSERRYENAEAYNPLNHATCKQMKKRTITVPGRQRTYLQYSGSAGTFLSVGEKKRQGGMRLTPRLGTPPGLAKPCDSTRISAYILQDYLQRPGSAITCLAFVASRHGRAEFFHTDAFLMQCFPRSRPHALGRLYCVEVAKTIVPTTWACFGRAPTFTPPTMAALAVLPGVLIKNCSSPA